jgi:probable rRNA maturation factor
MPPEETSFVFRHPSRKILRRPLREFWKDLGRSVGNGCASTCLITTDHELRELNRRFRGEDYATDVLSFPPGDIAISLDRARDQALEHGHPIEEELKILMLHGILHLAGMDHERDSGEMAREERRWRRKLGLPQGLVERSRAGFGLQRGLRPQQHSRGLKPPLQAKACSTITP